MTTTEALKQIIDLADNLRPVYDDDATLRRIIDVAEDALQRERERTRERVALSRSRKREAK